MVVRQFSLSNLQRGLPEILNSLNFVKVRFTKHSSLWNSDPLTKKNCFPYHSYPLLGGSKLWLHVSGQSLGMCPRSSAISHCVALWLCCPKSHKHNHQLQNYRQAPERRKNGHTRALKINVVGIKETLTGAGFNVGLEQCNWLLPMV